MVGKETAQNENPGDRDAVVERSTYAFTYPAAGSMVGGSR
jgi:hypothetical protein